MTKQQQDRVLACAASWVGRKYRDGEPAQCANFVRTVFGDAGIVLGVAEPPDDIALIPGYPIGPSYADSFAGDDVGECVDIAQREPGDIVMYQNTYGDYPVGVITHVGIYVGDDTIIHRPTASAPVRRDRYDYMTIAEIRRPRAGSHRLLLAVSDGKVDVCKLDRWQQGTLRIKLFFKPGKVGMAVEGELVDRVKSFRLAAWGRGPHDDDRVIWYTDNTPELWYQSESLEPLYNSWIIDIDLSYLRVELDGQLAHLDTLFLTAEYE